MAFPFRLEMPVSLKRLSLYYRQKIEHNRKLFLWNFYLNKRDKFILTSTSYMVNTGPNWDLRKTAYDSLSRRFQNFMILENQKTVQVVVAISRKRTKPESFQVGDNLRRTWSLLCGCATAALMPARYFCNGGMCIASASRNQLYVLGKCNPLFRLV